MAAIKNRRKGPDTMVKLITIFSILTWLIIIIAFIVFYMSRPSLVTYNTARANLMEHGTAIIVMKFLMFFNVIMCVWGMIANAMRNQRKSDKFHISLVVATFVSVVGFIAIIIIL